MPPPPDQCATPGTQAPTAQAVEPAAPGQAGAAEGGRTIRGDVGADGLSVRHAGDLRIEGNICAAIQVDVTGDLTVCGSVEGAAVACEGTITVEGNIVGRRTGRCVSRGAMRFRSANVGVLESEGDIAAALDIVGSRVVCAGAVSCERGTLQGGHVTANAGVTCAVLGSLAGAVTIVEVGIDERLRRCGQAEAAPLRDALQRAQHIRTQVSPLLANIRALNAQQREKATELIHEADELEGRTRARIDEIRRLAASSFQSAVPCVVVTDTLYPGVVIRSMGCELRIDEPIKGPVRVAPDATGKRLVITRLADQSECVAKSHDHAEHAILGVMALVRPAAA